MKSFIKRWLGIDTMYQVINDTIKDVALNKRSIDQESGRIDRQIAKLEKLHAMDVDENYRGPCTIILTGSYRGRGYVKFIDVDHDEFRHMVEVHGKRKSMFRNEDRIVYQGGSFQL